MTTFNELREQCAYAVGDPFMERVNRDHIAGFINSAARDLRNSGWLVRMQAVESVQLLSDNYEYDVPLRFAYIKELRIGDTSSDNASTVDSGTELDGAIATAGATTVDVDDRGGGAVPSDVHAVFEIVDGGLHLSRRHYNGA